jgi:hypothetical protein
MEYKNIDCFIKQKKLLVKELIGKKILYKAEKDKTIQEYEIDEIIDTPLAYRVALMKLRDCLSHNSQHLWKTVKISDIKFVKVEAPKATDDSPEKGCGIDREWLRKLKEIKEKNDSAKAFPPYKKPPTFPAPPVYPWDQRKIVCRDCGLDCSGTMGYCCPREHCPMGMGGTFCSTITKDASVKQIMNVPPEYTVEYPQSKTIPIPPTQHYDDAQYSYH